MLYTEAEEFVGAVWSTVTFENKQRNVAVTHICVHVHLGISLDRSMTNDSPLWIREDWEAELNFPFNPLQDFQCTHYNDNEESS